MGWVCFTDINKQPQGCDYHHKSCVHNTLYSFTPNLKMISSDFDFNVIQSGAYSESSSVWPL